MNQYEPWKQYGVDELTYWKGRYLEASATMQVYEQRLERLGVVECDGCRNLSLTEDAECLVCNHDLDREPPEDFQLRQAARASETGRETK